MTKKEDLQQEILANVTEGIKPSVLKAKLKRSKSADDIAQIPDPPPLPNNNPPNHLLQDQLKNKQQEIETLRKQLEEKNAELKATTQELDNSLFARIAAVKQFGQVYDKFQQVKKVLDETVEEASTEITSSDKQVSQLKSKLRTASQQIDNLQKELKWEKIKKGTSLPDNSSELPSSINYLKYAFYILLTIWLVSLLTNSQKIIINQND